MLLVDGERPADGDVWFRVITSSDHISKGRVHHAAFRKKNFFRPPQAGSNHPWAFETSGRLRSLAGSIEDISRYAENYAVTNNTHYVGVMYPSKRLARATVGTLSLDFFYTPIANVDLAHADLVANGAMPADKTPEHDELMHELVDCFKALHASQIEHLPAAKISLGEKIKLVFRLFMRRLSRTPWK
jgi:hypothetical protein